MRVGGCVKILNLGCGTKISSNSDVINIDWSVYLRVKSSRVLRTIAPFFIRGERLTRFNSLSDNVIVHNLAKGLPFPSNSVDVVYHSHLLEHLDKDVARKFLLEVKRVLKPDGIQRIVVPDLEKSCRDYLSHILVSENDMNEANMHDSYISVIIEQSVRKESFGTSKQKPLRRFIENTFLGDARRRGETHQWIYDRISLSSFLKSLGYKSPQIQSYNKSQIIDWDQYGLDLDQNGNEYKSMSLYLEVNK
jgi:SAM-dependent methyltransferase